MALEAEINLPMCLGSGEGRHAGCRPLSSHYILTGWKRGKRVGSFKRALIPFMIHTQDPIISQRSHLQILPDWELECQCEFEVPIHIQSTMRGSGRTRKKEKRRKGKSERKRSLQDLSNVCGSPEWPTGTH